VAPCAKHFPGHGDTHVDSHLGLPIITKSMDDLVGTELVPFAGLTSKEHNIPSIMTAHISLPTAFGDKTPASLSPHTIKLLRNKYQYEGVVVTDCLEMEAIVDFCGSPHGALKALQAGSDIAMICHRIDRQEGAINLVCREIEAGTFADATLWKQSGERIAQLKAQYAGSWSDVLSRRISPEDLSDLQRRNGEISQQAYAVSTTIVRDPGKVLPLVSSAESHFLVLLTPKPDSINPAVDEPVEEGVQMTADKTVRNTAGPSYNAFAKSVAKRHSNTQHIVYHADSKQSDLLSAVKGASAIILALRSADRAPWQRELLSSVAKFADGEKTPLILVSTYTPYDLLGTGSQFNHLTWLCTYEFTPPALEAATAVVFGEREAKGRLPVRLGNM
jgi:beta-N-acetylhexosaminidase